MPRNSRPNCRNVSSGPTNWQSPAAVCRSQTVWFSCFERQESASRRGSPRGSELSVVSYRMRNLMPESELAVDALAHGADFFRFDFVGHAHFARLAEGIDGISQVFFGQFVDVVVRTALGDFH